MSDQLSEDRQASQCVKRLPAGARQTQAMNFIRREMMNGELLFTSEHAQQAAQEFDTRDINVWAAIGALEKNGSVTKERLGPGKGFIIRLGDGIPIRSEKKKRKSKKTTKHTAKQTDGENSTTVTQLLTKIDSEMSTISTKIERLTEELERKEALRAGIQSLLGRNL
jgi:hypothetical protein